MLRIINLSCIMSLILLLLGCGSVQSVRLRGTYGPFSAEIEIVLRAAAELEAKNGPDCPEAAALREQAAKLEEANRAALEGK